METLVILQLVLIGVLMWFLRKEQREKDSFVSRQIDRSEEVKKTLMMGLAYRFDYPRERNDEDDIVFKGGSDLFIKQTPMEFEDFVARILKQHYGGNIYTTPESDEYGIDFEHYLDEELFIGQVNVSRENISAGPVATLHSNMVRNGAKGGYVITTSNFTKSAYEYAKDLDIKLIDGVKLVDYWLETMDAKIYEPDGEYA
ncbi:restriction endonuclease [Aquisalibacillus elongatus]|uniref:Restriction system protein n=1 Tax=Aquisalibacillus elongatus TaxID=485577 RepID=A0A3N5B7N1_9BACI|nr:restriction endonuclease [Aquisalibacillus elongatus]RPF53317.1 restriction system protein [Aquisalibacillus elongatus]